MNRTGLLVLLLNFAAIGALPIVFFKKDGRFNRMWWLTAGPFFLCPLFLVASYVGIFSPFAAEQPFLRDGLELTSVCLSVASVALLCFTMGTHGIPLALWHQDHDAPLHIVTYGAYRHIRHPFYLSFLLALFAAFLFAPHWTTLSTLVCAYLLLNFAAAREESRLRKSGFGSDYENYMRATGRFWPRQTR
jgi:protein-S-isoprenylcysteine O-methyltransferase Ste14